MKTNLLISISILLFSIQVNAQNDTKHQTEELKSIKTGIYTPYLTHQDGSGNYQGGLNELVFKVTKFQDYRIQPGVHKEIYMIFEGNPDRPDKYKNTMFLPDNEAFPITYGEKVYEGNKEMQDELGFAPRINRLSDGNRLVFLNGKIFVIEDWVDKDNYKLTAVMEHRAKKMGKLKLMGVVMKSTKKMKKMQPHLILQKYLDNAFNKQQEVYADWIKNPKNETLVINTESIRKLTIDAINRQRDDWRNSDEYKRIKERNRNATQSNQKNVVKIMNRTGKDIYIYEEGSSNGSRLSNNGTSRSNCKKNLYYSFNGNGSSEKGIKVVFENQSCGQNITVN